MLKLAEEHPENSSYLTTSLRGPIRKEAKAGTSNKCKSYYYGGRISMLKMICMTWQR
jgi:hypothetical protein